MASSIAWRSASMAALTAGDASCGIGENVGVRARFAETGGVGAAMCVRHVRSLLRLIQECRTERC